MHISSFQVQDYKSFLASGDIQLAEGFNVIVGRNNAGKTALIEALSLRFANRPHRSETTARSATVQLQGPSRVSIEFVFSREELATAIRDQLGHIHIPLGPSQDPRAVANVFSYSFTAQTDFSVAAEFIANERNPSLSISGFDALSAENRQDNRTVVVSIDPNTLEPVFDDVGAADAGSTFPNCLAEFLTERVYMFKAQRPIQGTARISRNPILASDASNLGSVLHVLRNENPERWDRFNHLVTRVFPDVYRISTSFPSDEEVEIRIWTTDPANERTDLAMPLGESGTGIGQVLAILYVATITESAGTIIIDEPQSFLNPGALRSLIDVLATETRHRQQYIVTTHSPNVIAAANPSTVLLVRKNQSESTIEEIDVRADEQLRRCLAEVGARQSDVFGADRILWVEGRTEEACFPKIIREILQLAGTGITILAVRATGDLEGKLASKYLEIYQRLSEGGGLQPPALAFVFDREDRTSKQLEDLARTLHGKVRFLPVRMFENYLLNPSAIAAIIVGIPGFTEDTDIKTKTVEGRVEAWFAANRWNEEYFSAVVEEGDRTIEQWIRDIDGARFLNDMFLQLSDARVDYLSAKIAYGEQLTGWIIDNSPNDLEKLASFLQSILATDVGG